MDRWKFQKASQMKLDEARTLLQAGHYAGAYYLLGYAVECALKACLTIQVKQYDFPDKKPANEAHTHDLDKLKKIAGLDYSFSEELNTNRVFENNWAVVKDWNESSRYDTGIDKLQAKDFFSACLDEEGILEWIKKRW